MRRSNRSQRQERISGMFVGKALSKMRGQCLEYIHQSWKWAGVSANYRTARRVFRQKLTSPLSSSQRQN